MVSTAFCRALVYNIGAKVENFKKTTKKILKKIIANANLK